MNIVRNNESRYVEFFVVSGSIKRLFSIDYVNVFLFSIFLQWILPGGKVWGYPTLLISRFINYGVFIDSCKLYRIYGNHTTFSKHFSLENSPSSLKQWLSNKAKKCSCFRKYGWREKSWPGRPQIHFLIDFQEIFSFTL